MSGGKGREGRGCSELARKRERGYENEVGGMEKVESWREDPK